MFDDAILDRIINDVCAEKIWAFLAEPLAKLRGEQREIIDTIDALGMGGAGDIGFALGARRRAIITPFR